MRKDYLILEPEEMAEYARMVAVEIFATYTGKIDTWFRRNNRPEEDTTYRTYSRNSFGYGKSFDMVQIMVDMGFYYPLHHCDEYSEACEYGVDMSKWQGLMYSLEREMRKLSEEELKMRLRFKSEHVDSNGRPVLFDRYKAHSHFHVEYNHTVVYTTETAHQYAVSRAISAAEPKWLDVKLLTDEHKTLRSISRESSIDASTTYMEALIPFYEALHEEKKYVEEKKEFYEKRDYGKRSTVFNKVINQEVKLYEKTNWGAL